MGKTGRAAFKTVFQIRLLRGHLFDKFRMYAEDDALVYCLVNLGEIVALVLVYDKEIAWLNGIELVVDQKLFAAGYGVIHFITVMDMHVHGFFILVEMGNGKVSLADSSLHGSFAGIEFFHNHSLLGTDHNKSITHRVQDLQGF